MNTYLINLDYELQQLALTHWQHFVYTVGNHAINTAKICLLKQKGFSNRQVANKLHLTIGVVKHGCKKCSFRSIN